MVSSMKIALSLCFILSTSFYGKSLYASQSSLLKNEYIAVGISGVATYRMDSEDITNSTLGDGSQPNSAWTHLVNHPLITKRFFLTHKDGKSKRREVLEEFEGCPEHKGLLIQANSWGAANGNALAKSYFRKCGRKADFFILVDGIRKPLMTAYRSKIVAERCVNYYQRQDALIRGATNSGCINQEVTHGEMSRGTARYHIATEWTGMRRGENLLNLFLNGYNYLDYLQ